ncbi:MAG: hypothetical protein WBM41_15170, partial [Arenicellales bacterium]
NNLYNHLLYRRPTVIKQILDHLSGKSAPGKSNSVSAHPQHTRPTPPYFPDQSTDAMIFSVSYGSLW